MSQTVYDKRILDDLFQQFLQRLPQASVELVLEHDTRVLLTKRTNEPAKGEWFWPGTRLYKGETFEACAHRVAREELGIDVELCCRVGTYAHFWDTGRLDDVESTHTVNVVFHAYPADDIDTLTLDEQHGDYRFVHEIQPWMHEYVRQYLADSEIMDKRHR